MNNIGLVIMSQDKEILMPFSGIRIVSITDIQHNIYDNNNHHCLGEYSSLEIAKSIIQEIADILDSNNYNINGTTINYIAKKVFYMPEYK